MTTQSSQEDPAWCTDIGRTLSTPSGEERLLQALLRNDLSDWSEASWDPHRLLEWARIHRVVGLLKRALSSTPFEALGNTTPQEYEQLSGALHQASRRLIFIELARAAELSQLIEQLYREGIEPLILKGSALAYRIYPEPHLRERSDTDLFVPIAQFERSGQILESAGYFSDPVGMGTLVNRQRIYCRTLASGEQHCIDLHRSVSNLHVFSRELDFDELAQRAVPIPALSPHARGLCNVDALLHACFHRASHCLAPVKIDGRFQLQPDQLIWLYDIHLLVQAMSAQEWQQLIHLARQKRMLTVTADAICTSVALLGTPLPAEIKQALSQPAANELSALLLRRDRWHGFFMELRSLPNHGDRLRWIGQQLFPPRAHLYRKYHCNSPIWLPWLYLRRIFGGLYRSPNNTSRATGS